jgi:DNA-binding NarL/FixJ family response regulator
MQAMLAGATGYMVKDATVEELAGAVHAAAAGDAWLSAPIAVKLLSWLREGQRGSPPREGELTARELDVLRMVAEGRDNADIAEALLVDEHKVKTLVGTILTKLQ